MSMGFPIVVSDLEAFTEVLGHTGLTFRIDNAHDLEHQLAHLLDDFGVRLNIGCRARQRVVEYYSRDRMTDLHAHLYRHIVAENRL